MLHEKVAPKFKIQILWSHVIFVKICHQYIIVCSFSPGTKSVQSQKSITNKIKLKRFKIRTKQKKILFYRKKKSERKPVKIYNWKKNNKSRKWFLKNSFHSNNFNWILKSWLKILVEIRKFHWKSVILTEIENFVEKLNFGRDRSQIENFIANRNFDKKSKIQTFVRNLKFYQTSKISANLESRNFCRKSYIWSKLWSQIGRKFEQRNVSVA